MISTTKIFILDPSRKEMTVKTFENADIARSEIFGNANIDVSKHYVGGMPFMMASVSGAITSGKPSVIDEEGVVHVSGKTAVVSAGEKSELCADGLTNSEIGVLIKSVRNAKDHVGRLHMVLIADNCSKKMASAAKVKKPWPQAGSPAEQAPSGKAQNAPTASIRHRVMEEYNRFGRYKNIAELSNAYDELSIEGKIIFLKEIEWLAGIDNRFAKKTESEMREMVAKKVELLESAINEAAENDDPQIQAKMEDVLHRMLIDGVPAHMLDLPVTNIEAERCKEKAVAKAAEKLRNM